VDDQLANFRQRKEESGLKIGVNITSAVSFAIYYGY